MLDNLEIEDAVKIIEKKYSAKIPKSFWIGLEDATFGEFADKFIALGVTHVCTSS
jgi:hypothetical protein